MLFTDYNVAASPLNSGLLQVIQLAVLRLIQHPGSAAVLCACSLKVTDLTRYPSHPYPRTLTTLRFPLPPIPAGPGAASPGAGTAMPAFTVSIKMLAS